MLKFLVIFCILGIFALIAKMFHKAYEEGPDWGWTHYDDIPPDHQ